MVLSFRAIAQYIEHPDVHIHEHFQARFHKIEYLNPSAELHNDVLYLCTITEFSLHNHRIENQSFIILDDLSLHEKINISREVNSIILTSKQTQFTQLQKLNGLFASCNQTYMELQQMLLEEQDTDPFWNRVSEFLEVPIFVEQDGKLLYPQGHREKPSPSTNRMEMNLVVADIEFLVLAASKDEFTLLQSEIFQILEPLYFQILKRYTASFEPMEKKMSKIVLNLLQSQTPVLKPLEDTVWEDRIAFRMYLLPLPEKAESLSAALTELDAVAMLTIPLQDTLLVLYAMDSLHDLTESLESVLTDLGLPVTTGYPFSDIDRVQDVWKALRLHLQRLRKSDKTGIFRVGDAALEILIGEYEQYAGISPFIHDVIWQMLASDDKESGELLDTLHFFLLNERSFLKTSKEMDLHRNSIVYRINKITGRYPIDLEDPIERQNLLLSCKLLSMLQIEN